MKQQQLFNSFWLASTTVVLATQLAWADIVQVSPGQSNSTASSEVSLETPKTTTSNNNNLDLEQFTSPTPISPDFPASADFNSRTTKTQAPSPNPQQSSSKPTVRNTEESLETPNTTNSGLAISQNILDLEQFTSPTPISPEFPAPAGSNTSSGENEAPSYLNPSPNPLQFPTKPQEVQVQGTQPITLQQAFDLARRNNRQLQIATLTLERSRAAVREAQAALYPNLSANTDVTRQQSASGQFQTDIQEQQQAQQREQLNQIDPEQLNQLNQRRASVGLTPLDPNQSNSDQFDSNASTGLSGTLQLSYDVYTSGERSGRIRAAQEQLRIDQLDVERIAEQLRLDVSNDYYDLQQADEQVRINSAAVTNAEASLRDAQALEAAGVGTRFDVLRFQVNLANASQNLTNSLSDREIARRQLATRLSLAQSVSVTAADPVEIAGLWNIPLQDSIVLAFQNRAELQQELAQRNISEQQRRIALSTIRPRISLVSSYNVLDSFDTAGGLSDGYSLGARLTWNLFDGGAAQARANQEEANKTISETRFADSRNNIRLQVESAYADLQSNLENIQTASVALEQAREALRLARLRFQAGVGTQTDVIAAENDLTQAEGNRVRAILDYNRALANLQRAISSGQPR